MSNVIRFTHPRRSREEIRQQASIWLTRMDAGLSAEENQQFGVWLNEDPAHADMLMEMAALWDQMSVLSGLSDIFPLEQYGPAGAKRFRRRLLLAAAGLAAVSLPAGTLLLDTLRSAAEAGAPRRYETAVGEQTTVDLPDGSVIVLNTDTLVEIAYATAERRVLLRRGEALFTVASDSTRPFRVYAGGRMVEAVGTAFTVQRSVDDDVEVMVTEGKVKFQVNASPGAAATSARTPAAAVDGPALSLQAGEYLFSAGARANALPEKVVMEPEEMEVRLAWREGMLMFDAEPLEEVLEEFNRYTTIRLEADPAIRGMRVNVLYPTPTGDIDQLLDYLRENLQVDTRRISQYHVLLTPRR